MGRLSKELKPKRDSRGLRISKELLETAKLDDRPIEVMAAESVIVIDPVLLGGVAGGGGVLEKSTDRHLGDHLVLDSEEDLGEVELAGIGRAWHMS